jgi:hypothetical protein
MTRGKHDYGQNRKEIVGGKGGCHEVEEEGEGVEIPGHLDVSLESRYVKCCPIIVVMLLVGKAATRERERDR